MLKYSLRAMLAAVVAALAIMVPAQPAGAQDFQPTRFSVEVRGEAHGERPDVILIPGLGSSRDVWDEEAERLAATHRLHLVQFSGFAGEPAGPAAEDGFLAPAVQELDAYIVAQGLQRPAVIGHSLGGLAGMMLARAAPAHVGRLMVVDTLPFFSVIFDPNATPETVAPQARAMAGQMVAMGDADFAQQQHYGMARLVRTPERREEVAGWTIASDRAVFAQAMLEVMTTDMRGEIAAITTPMTVLYAYDAAMGPEAGVDGLYGSAYAPAADARLKRIDGALHFLMLDQPEAFHTEVEAFLR